ncbi:MAG: glycosyltransferase [Deltaproteobacteria bacterium]|nr:glycosyltransferase [Deltaproteobacteria bacterium]
MDPVSFWIAAHGASLLGYLGLTRRWILDRALFPRLEPHGPLPLPSPAPLVSVVVPARDEEQTMGACLARLTASEYPALEIVVVNDQSTDRTGAIAGEVAARDPRVRVVDGIQRPDGWTGKNWAIHQGAGAARGTYLLIVDADTELEPRAIPEAVAWAEAHAVDLLTVFPRVRVASFWERAVLPALGLIPSYRLDKINDPRSRDANAVGYFLLFRRAAFDAIGGYESIRARVGEDWIIAKRIKSLGLKLHMLLAPDLVTKGFGPTLHDLRQGFVKNFMLILDGRKPLALVMLPIMLALALFLWMPFLALLQGGCALIAEPHHWRPAVALLGLGVAELMALQSVRRAMDLTARIDERGLWLQPLGATVIAAMWVAAIVRTALGLGLTWRGRTYQRV